MWWVEKKKDEIETDRSGVFGSFMNNVAKVKRFHVPDPSQDHRTRLERRRAGDRSARRTYQTDLTHS